MNQVSYQISSKDFVESDFVEIIRRIFRMQYFVRMQIFMQSSLNFERKNDMNSLKT